jgi:hypothetical protein
MGPEGPVGAGDRSSTPRRRSSTVLVGCYRQHDKYSTNEEGLADSPKRRPSDEGEGLADSPQRGAELTAAPKNAIVDCLVGVSVVYLGASSPVAGRGLAELTKRRCKKSVAEIHKRTTRTSCWNRCTTTGSCCRTRLEAWASRTPTCSGIPRAWAAGPRSSRTRARSGGSVPSLAWPTCARTSSWAVRVQALGGESVVPPRAPLPARDIQGSRGPGPRGARERTARRRQRQPGPHPAEHQHGQQAHRRLA